jgi:cytoskeletal protein CcmA (bactofilin family)
MKNPFAKEQIENPLLEQENLFTDSPQSNSAPASMVNSSAENYNKTSYTDENISRFFEVKKNPNYRTPPPSHPEFPFSYKTNSANSPQSINPTTAERPFIPETVIGQGVNIRGELNFQRFLRIDGSFEGQLVSNGDLLVGSTGSVKSEHLHLRNATIEGYVEANLTIDEALIIRSGAQILGDIETRSLTVEPGAFINGHIHVYTEEDSTQLHGDETNSDTMTEQAHSATTFS